MSPPAQVTSVRPHRLPEGMRRRLQLAAMSSPATPGTTWEYLTAPVLIHNTQAILNNFGRDGWELVTVTTGANGEQLVAWFKRPKQG
jgi:hypothetical protein